ncbi:Mak10 subunit, NatC N-terminal acetyltransferase-domain-containing protein [Pelagophyceae sp. CCMP2097]|nr:Mak10 subunit, NatC N-terminal acetyltransferase-domain-containing protein [Pelagophyceae sp. CCMP2097]
MSSFDDYAEGEAWVDVTQLCVDAAKAFDIDELLSAPTFSLFDSMSALELMDPKMDAAGCEPARTIAELVAEGVAPSRGLTLARALGVAERLLAREVAWADGGAVAETVMTCLYCHDSVFAGVAAGAATAPCAALAAVVTCTVQMVDVARRVVLRADIYEEEDFCPSTFGLAACEAPLAAPAHALCAAAEALLAPAVEGDGDAAVAAKALLGHVRYRRALLLAVVELEACGDASAAAAALDAAEEALKDVGDLDAKAWREAEARNTAASPAAASDAASQLAAAAIAPAPRTCFHDTTEASLGFDAGACRSLVGAAARGATAEVPRAKGATAADRAETRRGALQSLRGLRRALDLRELVTSLDFSLDGSGGPPRAGRSASVEHALVRLDRAVRRVGSARHGAGRHVLARSLAALELGGEGSALRHIPADDAVAFASTRLGRGLRTASVFDVVADALVSGGAPACVVATAAGAHFCAEASRCVVDALRLGCSNRARHTSRSAALLLDWANLCVDAERCDADVAVSLGLAPAADCVPDRARDDVCVGAWALKTALGLMTTHLKLQVELELCASSRVELEALYWYWEYLLSAQLRAGQTCRAARTALRDELLRDAQQQHRAARAGKQKHRQAPPQLSDAERLLDQRDDAAELVMAAERAACRATQRLCASSGTAVPGEVIYTSWDLRFAHRFSAFAAFSPMVPAVAYSDYDDLTRAVRSRPRAALLQLASDEFGNAKALLDRALKFDDAVLHAAGTDKADLFALAKATVVNRVAVAQALRGDAPLSNIKFDFSLHDHFPRITP